MKRKSIVELMKRFRRDDRGNLTMILGIAAVPLVAAAGLAVDMARITEARSAIQNAADGAALAAALAQGTTSEREAIGESYAAANLTKLYGVTATPVVDVDGDTVNVTIDTVVDGTLLAVAFSSSGANYNGEGGTGGGTESGGTLSLPSVAFAVSSTAEAELGESYYRCMIALNPSANNAIYIRGTGEFETENCWVHSDSASASGIHRQGNADATADGFTVVGNYANTGGGGDYSVEPETGADVSGDPINLAVSDPGGSASSVTIKKQNGNVSLNAAKYNNITVQTQGLATFTPGVHYITGTLSIASQARVVGTGVTLVLLGSNAKIDMNSNAMLQLQAPTSGDYPGFVVIGDKSATTVQTNTVQGGASTWLRGVWYTPEHKLYTTGNGDFNINSAYFPVVVDNAEIGGNGVFNLGFDWDEYGYPEPTALIKQVSAKARLTN